MKTLIFSALFVLGCQTVPSSNDKVQASKTTSIDDMFQSYQKEVYQECSRLDRPNCYGWSEICVGKLRQGEGRFSCGNGISPIWYPFHRRHLSEEKVLDCLGKGNTLVSCREKFGKLHTASPTVIHNNCVKNKVALDPCSSWQGFTKPNNEKLCDACIDKCMEHNKAMTCGEVCNKQSACKEVPAYKSEQQCLIDSIETPCRDLVHHCSTSNNDINEECLTNE
jgi:hypothetical protein